MQDMSLINNALLIVLLPLFAYIIQTAVGKRLPRMGDWLSTGAIFASFLLACKIFAVMWSNNNPDWVVSKVWTWIDIGFSIFPYKIDVGVRIDNMTAVMLLMVTLCATLIHLFSSAYMRGHDGKPEDGFRYASFFSYLSLFTSAMLGLIISDNLLTLFMCWEVMGLCSYLLIGFYRHKPSAANASLKAFMTTRVGDTGLFIALLALFTKVGSFRFVDVYAAIEAGTLTGEFFGYSFAFVVGLLVFVGTVGKSAQMPLHVWLPDAMEGPTPVSALIHAATMVAAGVYLIIRMFPLLQYGGVLPVVAYTGAITCFFAAIIAIKQTDLKKVLAYSTLSQLGYMVLAVGVGAYTAAFLHLITHAVFKACLFMCSGSVIWAMHHEQEMTHMGGLRKKLPITFACMMVATLAISGVPLFSGFVSKDAILANTLGHVLSHHSEDFLLVILSFATAAMTAFYMFRLMFMTFFGEPKDKKHYDHAHEGGWNMYLPLIVLAVFSIGVFYKGFGASQSWFNRLIVPPVLGGDMKIFLDGVKHAEHEAHGMTVVLSIALAALGIFFSYLVYIIKKPSAASLSKIWPKFVHKAVDGLYYFDYFYIKLLIQKVFMKFADFLAVFDTKVVDEGIVDGVAAGTMHVKTVAALHDDILVDQVLVDGLGGALPREAGNRLKRAQSGKVQQYLTVVVLAVVILYFLKTIIGVAI